MSSETQQIFPFHIKTNKTKRQYLADYKKENPLRIPMFVNGLNLTMDAEFQEKAAVLILIDGLRRFDSTDEENSLKGHIKYSIPLGLELPRDKNIEVFVWNEKDDNVIECEFDLFLDEELKPFRSESVPLSRDIFNQLVSQSEIIFPFKTYLDEVQYKLIDMKGYKKLIVLMSSSTVSFVVTDTNYSLSENIIDANINSKTGDLFMGGVAPTIKGYARVDFGTKKLRNLSAKFEMHASSNRNVSLFGIMRVKLFISDDDENYTEITSNDYAFYGNNIVIINKDAGIYDFRYAKIELEDYDNGDGDHRFSNNTSIYEIFDNATVGGQASLSFEIFNSSSGQWMLFIPANEFETITNGEESLSQIGDVTTKSISNKTYALPSTQKNLRAVLTITGGIETGVSIEMIS